MAACTPVRVDHLDFNESRHVAPSRMVYNPDEALVYIVYTNQWESVAGGAAIRNHAAFFRTIDPATQALGTPVEIVSGTSPDSFDIASLVRLDDGVLIVLIRTNPGGVGNVCKAYESDDEGLTWSGSPATVFTSTGSGADPVGLGTDGTNVWAWGWRTSANKDMYFNKRTTVDTWGSEALIYNGTSGSDLWEYYDIDSQLSSSYVGSSTLGFYSGLHEYLPGNMYRLACLRTDDGSTFSEVTIKDYGADASASISTNPRVVVTSAGRIYVGWLEASGTPGTPYRLCVAYTDDDAATWAVIGTPPDIQELASAIRFGFDIDSSDRLYFSAQYADNEFRIYRSGASPGSTAGWSLIHSCEYDNSTVAVTGGASMMVVSTDESDTVLHVFAGINVTVYGLYLLEDSFEVPGGGPGPPAPEPNPTGADENNIYVRKVLGPNSGGWSVHTYGVTCWMPWDEGDFDTGREVPILTAGDEVWPQIQDPYLVGIINRIEAPELYGIRKYIFGVGFDQSYDPLSVNIETKHYDLDGPHDRNVVRALYLKYRRSGAPFTMELWVDGKIVNTYEFGDTQGEPVEKFRAVPRFGNVGSTAWLRVRDESLDPLIIDSIEFVFIKKGRRGNRA